MVTVRGAFEELRTVQPSGCALTLPAATHQGSNSSPPSATLAVVRLLCHSRPSGCEVVIRRSFDLYFSITSDNEHLFM